MRSSLVFMIFISAFSAKANPLCGAYLKDQAGANRWVIFSDNLFAKVIENQEVQSVHRVDLHENHLRLRDLETGQINQYQIQADGQQFESLHKGLFQERYRREQWIDCSVKTPSTPRCPPAYAGTDEFFCATSAYDQKDTLSLQSLCQQGLAYACLKLAELRDHESDQAKSTLQQNPDECAQANAPEDTCGSLLSRSLMPQIPAIRRDTMPGSPVPNWPPAYFNELASACQKISSPELCRQATARLWDAGHYLPAKALLSHACQRQLGKLACMGHEALEKLGAPRLADIKPAKFLPCGTFHSLNGLGLMRELEFTDRGLVNTQQDPMQARIMNGTVRVRHDKGGDFIFLPIGTQWLLGADPWHRYTVFERQGGKSICISPPMAEDQTHKDTKNDARQR